MNHTVNLFARLALSLMFIVSGWQKIGGYAATQGYMDAMGVPGALLPLVIALELGGGLALLAGLFTRPLAVLFALFTLAAGILFHGDFADPMQSILLMKNVSIAGGFAILALHGAGAASLDALIARGRAARPAVAGGRA